MDIEFISGIQVLEQDEDMEIKLNTSLNWLKRLVKCGAITSVDGKRTYSCVCVCEREEGQVKVYLLYPFTRKATHCFVGVKA